jgi:ubiquinone/menaquinone biosynthesis C-methylase UbiE
MNRYFYSVYGTPNLKNDDRSKSRVKVVKDIINNVDNIPIKKYLDFGCGEAQITKFVGKELKINDVTCIDVKKPKDTEGFKFIKIDPNIKRIPLDSNSIELITSFMVLHHLRDPEKYIKEFNRVLKPSGLVIVREHDIQSSEDNDAKLFLDMLHGLYEIVWSSTGKQEDPEHIKNFYAVYRKRENWTKMFENNGFKRLSSTKMNELYNLSNIKRIFKKNKFVKNPLHFYYAVYQKV